MKKTLLTLSLLLGLFTFTFATSYEDLTKDFILGDTKVQSISVMTFSPEGILFVGDSKAGKLFALDLQDRTKPEEAKPFGMEDVESKLGSLMGTDAKGVVIHDLAVNPISQNIYLAVSRSDANQLGFWKSANDLAYSTILLKVAPDGEMTEVDLSNIRHSSVVVPKVIKEGTQNWRKSDKRTEAITDIAYDEGKLYIAGLSNEEFASALRVLSFPFTDKNAYSTIEVWHVAHKASETEAPIRSLIPYELNGEKFILASYTCTPFVSIPVASLKNGQHVKSKTLAEFGAGNMAIDLNKYTNKKGKDYLMMSNSAKAMIRIDPSKIPTQKGLTEPLKEGEYAIGLPHDVLSGTGVTHIDNLNEEFLLILQRMPNGHLNLRSYPKKYL